MKKQTEITYLIRRMRDRYNMELVRVEDKDPRYWRVTFSRDGISTWVDMNRIASKFEMEAGSGAKRHLDGLAGLIYNNYCVARWRSTQL